MVSILIYEPLSTFFFNAAFLIEAKWVLTNKAEMEIIFLCPWELVRTDIMWIKLKQIQLGKQKQNSPSPKKFIIEKDALILSLFGM